MFRCRSKDLFCQNLFWKHYFSYWKRFGRTFEKLSKLLSVMILPLSKWHIVVLRSTWSSINMLFYQKSPCAMKSDIFTLKDDGIWFHLKYSRWIQTIQDVLSQRRNVYSRRSVKQRFKRHDNAAASETKEHHVLTQLLTVADPGFSDKGRQPSGGGAKIRFY